jgi:hypothetical protein
MLSETRKLLPEFVVLLGRQAFAVQYDASAPSVNEQLPAHAL